MPFLINFCDISFVFQFFVIHQIMLLYFLEKQNCYNDVSEDEIIQVAIKTMGLNDIKQFNPHDRIIEYLL